MFHLCNLQAAKTGQPSPTSPAGQPDDATQPPSPCPSTPPTHVQVSPQEMPKAKDTPVASQSPKETPVAKQSPKETPTAKKATMAKETPAKKATMAKETPGPQPLVQDPFGHMQPKTPPKQGAPRPQAPNLQAQAAMPQAAMPQAMPQAAMPQVAQHQPPKAMQQQPMASQVFAPYPPMPAGIMMPPMPAIPPQVFAQQARQAVQPKLFQFMLNAMAGQCPSHE